MVISTLRYGVKILMVAYHELMLEIRLNKLNRLQLFKNRLLLDEIMPLITAPVVLEREPLAPRGTYFVINQMRMQGSRPASECARSSDQMTV